MKINTFLLLAASVFMMTCSVLRDRAEVLPLSYYHSLKNEVILPGIQRPIDEEAFLSACWAMEISGYRSDEVLTSLKMIYPELNTFGRPVQRAFWEAVYTLYPREFLSEARTYLTETADPKLFAMAAYYFLRACPGKESKAMVFRSIHEQFPEKTFRDDPILCSLRSRGDPSPPFPPLQDLLEYEPGTGCAIFVFFRENRDYPGIAIIRDENGKWIRKKNGDILHTRILGRSMSALPGTLTNGNTPVGVYTFQGISASSNVFIGSTPTIVCGLPFEYGKAEYFHDNRDNTWNITDYHTLIPVSWRDYFPIYEAWYAGKAGRSGIIVHGSTILQDLYTGKTYYPFTPSLGCMTHWEQWSGKGKLLHSEQQILLNGLQKCGMQKGFLYVIDLDARSRNLKLSDILSYIE